MNEYKRLPTKSLATVNNIQQPETEKNIGLYSPASEILTDFRKARPLMIEMNTSIHTAKELMTRAHVRLKLVIDREEHFRGVISLADLLSVKVMQARASTGLPIDDLTVAEVMTHKEALRAIEIQEFSHATIGDIITTMRTFGDQHVLVLNSALDCICGIVSSSDIARVLHQTVNISERACSFSDIYQAVRA